MIANNEDSIPIYRRCLDNVESSLSCSIVGEQRDVVNAKKNCKQQIQDVFNREGFKLSINSNGSNNGGRTAKFKCNECKSQHLNGTINVSDKGYTCELAKVDDFLKHLCMQQNWSAQDISVQDKTSENLEGITQQLAGIGIEAKVVVTANMLGQPAQSFEETLHFNFRAPNGQQVPTQTESPSPYWSNTATNVHHLTALPNYNIPAGNNFMMAANGSNLSTSIYPQREADGSNFQIGKRLRSNELPSPGAANQYLPRQCPSYEGVAGYGNQFIKEADDYIASQLQACSGMASPSSITGDIILTGNSRLINNGKFVGNGYYENSIVFNGPQASIVGNSACVNGKFSNCGEVNGVVQGSGTVVVNNSRNHLVTQNTVQDRHQEITANAYETGIAMLEALETLPDTQS